MVLPKQKIMVPRPFLIKEYNAHMGGTDLMDENLSRYRIGIRSKKWWWPIFTWFIEVTVTNAWQIHWKSGGKLMQFEFRREIATCYLTSYRTISKPGGRPRTSKSSVSLNRVPDDIRYDGMSHLVVETLKKKKDAPAKAAHQESEQCVTNVTWGFAFHAFIVFIQSKFCFYYFHAFWLE
ncbi:hypothetical protein JTB14_011872 [Gonioctena quinquepunctata]|nr:hypothetical protein JTB14_011872 [Gonioctena quinquepunctata]